MSAIPEVSTREEIRGRIVAPADPEYDEARAVYNGIWRFAAAVTAFPGSVRWTTGW